MKKFYTVTLPDGRFAIEVECTEKAMGGFEVTWGYYIDGVRLAPDPRKGNSWASHSPIEGITSREIISNEAALISQFLT